MARPDKYSTEQMIEALQYAHGMTTLAAEHLRCSHNTVTSYIQKHPTVRAAFELETEKQLDATELRLIKAINADDLTAIIFYLKTRGKRRGYVERMEFDIKIMEVVKRITQLSEAQGIDASDIFNDILAELDTKQGAPARPAGAADGASG